MAMLVGSLNWLEDHKHDMEIKFKESLRNKKGSGNEEIESNNKGPKLPDWFNSDELKRKNFLRGEEANRREFDQLFLKELKVNNVEIARKVMTKEELELVDINDDDLKQTTGRGKRHIHGSEEVEDQSFRIIYATRTHSQIGEFIEEFKKTRFASIFSILEVASRKSYCLEKTVNSAKNSYLMSEKCKEKRSSKGGCEYYKYVEIHNIKFDMYPIKTQALRAQKTAPPSSCALPSGGKTRHKVADIEDVVEFFEQKKLCPYFSVRENIKYCDVRRLVIRSCVCPTFLFCPKTSESPSGWTTWAEW